MPKLLFTPEELKLYFTRKREHYYYKKSCDLELDMRIHADGVFPDKLIKERRPSESQQVFDYRQKIFKPITKPYFNKIESTLQKIRRSSDWSIRYGDESFDKIREGEKLIDYADTNYPVFGSLTNWCFSLLMRNYLIDANAIVIVVPMSVPEGESVFLEPVATIFNSCDVIDFAEGDFLVLKNKVGSIYYQNNRANIGESFYIVTTEMVQKYDQINGRKEFGITWEYPHGLEELPAFKVGGIVIDVYGNHSLYESRISGILPQFDEALREYSDLQASKVLHMFPKEWEFSQNECLACKGTGSRMDNTQTPPCMVECKACGGAAYIASGPYNKMIVKPAAADQQPVPNPAGGVITRDSKIIELQEKSCQDHIYNALAAINFEFLAATPLNQSGVAKEVDKDELNNTVHAIAEDLVRILDKVYYFIGRYRYSTQYTTEQIIDMMPMVSVPEKYDILNTSYYDEQISSAIKNKLSAPIINAMEVAYATKAFNNDPKVAEHVGLILKLDPLAGISEDDKMSRLSNNGITQLDYVVSSNINKFVDQLIETTKGFVEMDTEKQKEAVYKLAEEQINEGTKSLLPPADEIDPPVN